jgi:putative membrane protein
MMSQRDFFVKPGEWAVLICTLAYTIGFSVWFLTRGNYEFIVYVTTMVLLIALVGAGIRNAEFPTVMLWALSAWGLAHMAGGGVPVGDSVLYSYKMINITGDGELTLLKYDQVVHAYGFAITAWVLWHLLIHHYPVIRHSWTAYVFPALASVGLGAVNEIIEFSAVLLIADTNVGGYYNTALDLVFNTGGAVIAMLFVARAERERRAA